MHWEWATRTLLDKSRSRTAEGEGKHTMHDTRSILRGFHKRLVEVHLAVIACNTAKLIHIRFAYRFRKRAAVANFQRYFSHFQSPSCWLPPPQANAMFRRSLNQLVFGQGSHLAICSKQRNTAISFRANKATNAQAIPCETI